MDFTFEFRDLASHSTHKSSVLDILLGFAFMLYFSSRCFPLKNSRLIAIKEITIVFITPLKT